MSAINTEMQSHTLDFQPDWEALDKFMREIEYDQNFNAIHNGELVSDINEREFKELMSC